PISSDHEKVLALAKACCLGGTDCLQLRAKEIQARPLLELAKRFVSICNSHNVISIINDRIDIAVLSQADGVHLGQTDISIQDARKLSTAPMICGISTHSPQELKAAIAQAPDYIALGPAFPTKTKPHLEIAGCDYIRKAIKTLESTGIPHVAIGGIDATNLDRILAADATSIAICSAVSKPKDPENACRQMKATILSFKQ
ncbi:MAG: thiamine phosphate synthase, partial [Planctomycetes bacterium]|nr:thiamine phosphate synthase [Planctomycetota bacterium]